MKYVVAILMAVIGIASAQNLLLNPGFEAWTHNMPTHWIKDDGISILRESFLVHGDSFSVRESLVTQTQSDADLYQTVAVHPNTYYQLSVWVWDGDSSGRIGIGIDWQPSGSEWSSSYSIDSTDWQQLIFTTNPSPSDAESASIVIRAYDSPATWDGDALLYIDDVYFAEVVMQPPVVVRVWHIPVNPAASVTENIYTKVSDDGSIVEDSLYYGINDLDNPIRLSHSSIDNDTFKYHVSGQSTGDTVFYFIRFVDDDGLETVTDTQAYYVGEFNITINEILYDTDGSDEGCFVELFGPGGTTLDGFSIAGVNGFNGSDYVSIDLTGHAIPGDGFFVIAQDSSVPHYDMIADEVDLQNSPDNVELRFYDITVDALGYGEESGWVFTGEWLPADDVVEDHSLGRNFDGYDSDNNLDDFRDCTVCTPGVTNSAVCISHDKVLSSEPSLIPNPVYSGIVFSSLVQNSDCYPVVVYNTLGQIVAHILKPHEVLDLSCGIYFLEMNNKRGCCAKIVVVK